MKEKIEQMYTQALVDDLPPNVFADQVLRLFDVSGSLPISWEQRMEEIKELQNSIDKKIEALKGNNH
jgi:hypothetical protein